mgnify:CR=1 FL=1
MGIGIGFFNVKILVIIPVFNEEKNLEKCINSFINQTHKLSQITIVDDGSTDNTPLIGRKIEKSHSNIQFLKKRDSKSIAQPGKKIIQAFNYGLNKSIKNFDLIGKFDADIELPKNYFEQMVNIFSKNKNIKSKYLMFFRKNTLYLIVGRFQNHC